MNEIVELIACAFGQFSTSRRILPELLIQKTNFRKKTITIEFSAIAIPYMTSNGLSESTAMGVYAAAGVWSIANDLIAGWLSENCTSPIGEFHQ